MGITHYGSQHFLTLIDCGPTRFAIWRPLVRHDSSSVIRELESIFYERGLPEEILTDNDTAFCSMEFRRFIEEWGIRLRHRCAKWQRHSRAVPPKREEDRGQESVHDRRSGL